MKGGQGAPLTPVFHHLISIKNEIKLPVCFLNIGGISNITIVQDRENLSELISKDIGPGNCLVDSWVRKNSNKKFDQDGNLASSGTKNEIIFEQAQELYANRNSKKKLSFDVNDFDISFVRGLSLSDGVATLTDFTASVIGEELSLTLNRFKDKDNSFSLSLKKWLEFFILENITSTPFWLLILLSSSLILSFVTNSSLSL